MTNPTPVRRSTAAGRKAGKKSEDGLVAAPSAAPARAVEDRAQHSHLDGLARVARLLTTFETVRDTLEALAAAVYSALPLRTLVVVEAGIDDGPPVVTGWRDDALPGGELVLEKQRARAACDQFVAMPVSTAAAQAREALFEALRLPSLATALPLMASDGSVLGVIHLTSSSPLDKADLAFADALAAQLALALQLGNERKSARAAHERAEEIERTHASEAAAEQRARTDAETSRYAEAMEAIRGRDNILAVVAHDLRNPLGSVMLHCDLLLKPSQLDEDRPGRPEVEAIGRATKRMRRIIDDLLDAEAIDAGALRVRPAPVSVVPLVVEARDLLAPLAKSREVELRNELPPALPLALADAGRIGQVLSNLVTRAIRCTPPRGSVTLRAEAIPGRIAISVTDAGATIPEEDLGHAFERYWPANTTRSVAAALGLTIARGIIATHGGEISAQSEPGQGTTFTFTLPLAEAVAAG